MPRSPFARELSRALSRRALLLGASGTALASCAPRPATVTPGTAPSGVPSAGRVASSAGVMAPAPRADAHAESVAIVGAGLSGLVCAFRLAARGVPVVVYEGRASVGGRVRTDRGTFGVPVELGGEFVDTGHTQIQKLAVELGLDLVDLDEKGASGASIFHFEGRSLGEGELLAALRPALRAAAHDAETLHHPRARARPTEIAAVRDALDALSLEAWLAARGVGSLGASVLRAAYTSEFGLEPARLSALTVIESLAMRDGHVTLFGSEDARYRIKDGSDAMARALAARLGSAVFPSHRLEDMRRRADGLTVLTFAVGEGEPSTQARIERAHRRVVLATPFTALRRVSMHPSLGFSASKARAIAELPYGTNGKHLLGFSSRPWNAKGFTGEVLTDRPLQTSWDATRALAGARGVLTVFKGGEAGAKLASGDGKAQARDAVADLAVVLPGVEAEHDGRTLRIAWAREELSGGSYATYGLRSAVLREGLARPEGPVTFCGEHTSTRFPGFMEGAVDSGERAAAELVASHLKLG